MVKPTNQILVSILVLPLLACLTPPHMFPTAAAQYAMPGQLEVVTDVKNNREIQDLGRYTVDVYNRQQLSRGFWGSPLLVYTEVLAAERQVVAGTKYYLMILASQRIYRAEVVVPLWPDSMQVLSFIPS